MSMNLRKAVLRIAHENPDLRKELVSILARKQWYVLPESLTLTRSEIENQMTVEEAKKKLQEVRKEFLRLRDSSEKVESELDKAKSEFEKAKSDLEKKFRAAKRKFEDKKAELDISKKRLTEEFYQLRTLDDRLKAKVEGRRVK